VLALEPRLRPPHPSAINDAAVVLERLETPGLGVDRRLLLLLLLADSWPWPWLEDVVGLAGGRGEEGDGETEVAAVEADAVVVDDVQPELDEDVDAVVVAFAPTTAGRLGTSRLLGELGLLTAFRLLLLLPIGAGPGPVELTINAAFPCARSHLSAMRHATSTACSTSGREGDVRGVCARRSMCVVNKKEKERNKSTYPDRATHTASPAGSGESPVRAQLAS